MRRLLLITGTIALLQGPVAFAQAPELTPEEALFRATVVAVIREETETFQDLTRTVQIVRMQAVTGPEKGKEFMLENGIVNGRSDMRLKTGQTVVIEKLIQADGDAEYLLREQYRLPAMFWLLALFFALACVLGGRTGFSAIIGLCVSIAILVLFVVPQIAGGSNPLFISLIGSFAIACTSLYLAHGFKKRTSVALLSTLVTLSISVLVAVFFVSMTKLFGTGSEEAVFLQLGPLEMVNLRGLLLGGMVIGCLGVLDDITTAQTAAIDEIRKANPSLTRKELWKAGMSVGREHIASLINTLALAYAGASLPLLLLFQIQQDYPLWFTLNSEFLVEEIVRTLVGSSALLLAVPISTWFAVTLLQRSPDDHSPSLHSHVRHL